MRCVETFSHPMDLSSFSQTRSYQHRKMLAEQAKKNAEEAERAYGGIVGESAYSASNVWLEDDRTGQTTTVTASGMA